MNRTRLYFRAARFCWECLRCGKFQNEEIPNRNYDGEPPLREGDEWTVTCAHCGKRRRVVIHFRSAYKPDKEHRERVDRIKQRFDKRMKAIKFFPGFMYVEPKLLKRKRRNK